MNTNKKSRFSCLTQKSTREIPINAAPVITPIAATPKPLFLSYDESSYFSRLTTKTKTTETSKLPPGWIVLKKGGVPLNNPPPPVNIRESMKSLVRLHEQRTTEYIEHYGYDEWEFMFRFPHWREEQTYLEEMEKRQNEEEEEEEEENEDEFMN